MILSARMILATQSFHGVYPWVTSAREHRVMNGDRERTLRDHGEEDDRQDAAEDSRDRDWPRAAWARAIASNA